ncbi:MAG: hypothetical protein QE570_07285 [Verrucomicrobiota bacterium]|jgi:hypothetical protein|nr:hypothetical protein [Verrucomicrobiota bacterium]
MNDHDLRSIFAQQRQCDHENAPAWRPELLNRPLKPQRHWLRWIPVSLVTACVIAVALFFADPLKHDAQLSELPPLLDSTPGALFASLEPSLSAFDAPSDFLLPTHLNLHIP